jgi:hypothetical protein
MDLSYKHSRDWLCQQHSFEKIKMWVNSLTSFYFFRAFGGHANDPDIFETWVKYTDKNDLENILTALGINGLTEAKTSGQRTINNNEWFISIDFQRNRIEFLKGTNYNVTDKDFEATMDLDKTFKKLKLDDKVDRDIIYNPCCVSQERYNELWN